MTAILDGLRTLMIGVVEALGYAGLAFLSLLENLVPPVPSEFVLPFAGFLVAEGRLNVALVLLATSLGGFVGTTGFYWLGRVLGEERVRAFIGRYGRYVLLRVADYDDALAFFQRYDAQVVFWARFVPGVRSLISLPAGVSGMGFGRFALYTVMGTVLWNGALVTAGWALGERWQAVLAVVDRLEAFLWALLGLAVVGWVVWQLLRRGRTAA
ncbi:MAG TPA: DedA family protein [Trueperaceae bacterium]